MEDRVRTGFRSIQGNLGFQFDLSELQTKAIVALLKGEDVLAVLPTGSGKSMLFVIPPLLTENPRKSTSLVISPLLALSHDQKVTLCEKGIKSCVLSSKMSPEERKDLESGDMQIIFTSPEVVRLWTPLLKRVYDEKLCMVAFDEVHCVSQWGNDFRPEYKKVTALREIFKCPALALTGTMTRKIQRDLANILCLTEDTVLITTSPDRPDVYLSMKKCKRDYAELDWVVQHMMKHQQQSKKVLIYTQSVNECAKLFKSLLFLLKDNAIYIDDQGCRHRLIDMFHAHCDDQAKENILADFPRADGHLKVLVATIAFGMGIQVPDVTVVVQWGLPSNVLDYWQMMGRCARSATLYGISVCYMFPVSLVRCGDNILRSVAESSGCIRKAVLHELTIQNTPNVQGNHSGCNLQCPTLCSCQLCRCCDRCRDQCHCAQKSVDVLTDYLETSV